MTNDANAIGHTVLKRGDAADHTQATRILTLHAKNAAKVTRVTLSRAYFMAGPHTQPPAPIIHSEMRPSRVAGDLLHFAEGSSTDEKTRGRNPVPYSIASIGDGASTAAAGCAGRRASVRARTAGADLKPAALARRVSFFVLPSGADCWIRCSCDGGTGRANLATHRCSHFL